MADVAIRVTECGVEAVVVVTMGDGVVGATLCGSGCVLRSFLLLDLDKLSFVHFFVDEP